MATKKTTKKHASKKVASKRPSKETVVKKTLVKKKPAKKTAAGNEPVKKTTAKAQAAKKTAPKKKAAKKATVQKKPAKKTAAKKDTTKKKPARKTQVKQTPAKKTTTRKAAPTKISEQPARHRGGAPHEPVVDVTVTPDVAVAEQEQPAAETISAALETPSRPTPVAAASRSATTDNKPVIFLAFANDRDDTVGYLRNLPDEARRLRAVLEPAEQAGLAAWEKVVQGNRLAWQGEIDKALET